uniref:Retrovirus-related Pol polyprotein from transposon TNT 1-94 n=2 Tax=Cajanus cajan TaxID=3821 RepID=A0A151QMG6_CAJCA|nr:Retrovirus-related Pol polyprotein from transposon TNT 1-94 [Cajanus cajan]
MENLEAKTENLEYTNYVQQDQLLVAWLLASMSSPILTKMVGLKFAYQIWKRLEVYYAARTRAVIKKLKLQLRMIKKDKGINEYLLEIKKIVDSLAAVGPPISDEDHIDAILDGLPDEFDCFVTSITSRLDPYIVDEIEALLLAHEERSEKQKRSDTPLIHANTVSGPNQWQNPNQGRGRSAFNTREEFRGGRFHNRGGNWNNRGRFNAGRGNGRSNWNQTGQNNWNQNKSTCQICGKIGHIALNCYYRYNQEYQNHPQANNTQFQPSGYDISETITLATASTVQDPL